MPLRKLWNSLRGRQEIDAPTREETTHEKSAPRVKPPRRGRNPHAALCKQIGSLAPTTVLEIGVGDGTRAIAIIEHLRRKNGELPSRYGAIDAFEQGERSSVSLIQFHQAIRGIGASVKMFPLAIEPGLREFANTIGIADLVVITEPAAQWSVPTVQSALRRITHPQSCVLFFDEETWHRYDAVGVSRRAA